MKFSACLICNDDADSIDRYVQYYLKAGASEVLVYLDFGTPEPDYSQQSKVSVIKTETLFVEDGQPKRPAGWHNMQRSVYADAFERFSSDWLLICDVDEFVEGNRPIADILDDVPSDWTFFRIPVAEAVWGPGDEPGMPFTCTYFRLRAPRGFGKILSLGLYGKGYRYTSAGLMGHSVGKYFLKKGADLKPGIHMPIGIPYSEGPWCHDIVPDPKMILYHFEALSYDRWLFKWKNRKKRPRATKTRDSAAQLAFLDAFIASEKAGRMRELFDCVYQINKPQAKILSWLGLLRRKQLW